jgi:hypothetical protein
VDVSVEEIPALHDACLVAWSGDAPAPSGTTLRGLIASQHYANWKIWNLEDEARLRDAPDSRIARVKREIDRWNQQRNDLTEAIDAKFLESLADSLGDPAPEAELHSESAGMIVDRLSILALKIRAMDRLAAEAAGEGDDDLAGECRERAATLRAQRADLAACLARLVEETAAGRRRLRSWRAMKSYNDERLNPALRAEGRQGRGK